jgi:hypothetical protein
MNARRIIYRLRVIKPRNRVLIRCRALETMLLMCVSNERLFVIVTPRSRKSFHYGMATPLMKYWPGRRWFDTANTEHLFTLMVSCYSEVHCANLSREFCRETEVLSRVTLEYSTACRRLRIVAKWFYRNKQYQYRLCI